MKGIVSTIVLAMAVSLPLHAETPQEPPSQNQIKVVMQGCAIFGRVYLHLADLRDSGMEENIAARRAAEHMNSRGQTGSHLPAKQYLPATTRFAQFVYAHQDLRRETLYLRGLYDCALSKFIEDDTAFEQAQQRLDRDLVECQQQFAAETQRKELGECGSRAVAAALGQKQPGG